MKKSLYVLLAVALLGGGAFAAYHFLMRPPASIAEAILARKDEFPRSQYLLTPPAATHRLGRRPVKKEGRRLETEPTPCFFMAPTTSGGLSRMEVSYSGGSDLGAEFGRTLESFGVKASDDDTAKLILEDLKLVEGIGVPNPTAPCWAGEGTPATGLEVVTSEVVAGKARLEFGRKSALSTKAKANTSAGDASVASGWRVGEGGVLEGKDIVLTGGLSRVKVERSVETHDLGTNPAAGEPLPFPGDYDGNLTIVRFHEGEGRLTLRVDTLLNSAAKPPEGLKTCPVGEEAALTEGARCNFWLSPGNAMVSLSWNYETIEGVRQVVLIAKSYRTTLARP